MRYTTIFVSFLLFIYLSDLSAQRSSSNKSGRKTDKKTARTVVTADSTATKTDTTATKDKKKSKSGRTSTKSARTSSSSKDSDRKSTKSARTSSSSKDSGRTSTKSARTSRASKNSDGILKSNKIAINKIGFVSESALSNGLEETKQVNIELQKESRKIQSEFQYLVSTLDSLKQDFERQRILMSDSRRRQKEEEIKVLEKSLLTFQMKIKTEKDNKGKQLYDPIQRKINNAIQSYAKDRGYNLILSGDNGLVVYVGDKNLNLTDEVREEFNKSK